MKKHWNKYLIFTKLTRGDELISFAGIIDLLNNLVRVCRYIIILNKNTDKII